MPANHDKPMDKPVTANHAQSSNSDQSPSFEASLAELGDIVMRLESGALGLSESIGAYERGVTILHRLHDELAAVEERVNLLVRIDEQGRPVLAPLPTDNADAASAAPPAPAKKAAGRTASAAKTTRSKTLPGMDDAGNDA